MIGSDGYLYILVSTKLFFCGGRGLNPGPCIYHALSLPTELSSRGDQQSYL